jgi:hypothetical protein
MCGSNALNAYGNGGRVNAITFDFLIYEIRFTNYSKDCKFIKDGWIGN